MKATLNRVGIFCLTSYSIPTIKKKKLKQNTKLLVVIFIISVKLSSQRANVALHQLRVAPSPFGSSWQIYLKIYTTVEEERFPFQPVFSVSGKRRAEEKRHRTTVEGCAQNICKLDKASVYGAKRQSNCVHHSSLELRNVYSSFLFISKYLWVENILTSLVIREMPETAISWIHFKHIYILRMCMCREHTQGIHFHQQTRRGENPTTCCISQERKPIEQVISSKKTSTFSCLARQLHSSAGYTQEKERWREPEYICSETQTHWWQVPTDRRRTDSPPAMLTLALSSSPLYLQS